MNSDCFVFVEERDEFRMWQGLVGPHYTPAVDSLGNLSWTNNGNLVNPPTVNVSGRGLTITGIVDTAGDLPASAPQYTCYLVGITSPYHAYIFDGTSWTDLGVVGKGDTGDDGFSPVVTVTTITGGHEVSIEDANSTQTFDVMDGQEGAPGVGVPSGGTDGQMLVKDGSTDYATKWQNQPTIPTAYTSDPEMDGTASPGSTGQWADGGHVHPSDTSKQASITATGILKGAGSGSVSSATKGADYGALSFTVTLDDASWSNNVQTVSNVNFLASGYGYIVTPASASFADYAAAVIYADNVTTDGSMTFHCSTAPSSDLTVNILRVVSA